MVKILQYKNHTALVEVYLASGVVSPKVVHSLIEKFELMLAEFSDNVFLKKVYRNGDYFAIIVIESNNFNDVVSIGLRVEKRTRQVSSIVKSSVFAAINRLGQI